jgi:flagellar FliJ protein
MKKFQFRLEKVLSLRTRSEEAAKLDLGHAIGTLTEAEQRLEASRAARAAAVTERFTDDGGIEQFRLYEAYIERLDSEAAQFAREQSAAAAVVEEKRALYVEASRERKVIDKLRERRRLEWKKENADE